MALIRYSTYGWKSATFGIALMIVSVFYSAASHSHETKQGTLIVANSKAWKPFSYLTPDGEHKAF